MRPPPSADDAAALLPAAPSAAWTGCGDLGGGVAYHVTARLDPPPSTPAGSGRLVDAVRDRLGAAGVRLAVVGVDADPVTLQGRRDGLTVQVTGYPTRPMVLLDLRWPCLAVGTLDEDLLDEPPTPLALAPEAP